MASQSESKPDVSCESEENTYNSEISDDEESASSFHSLDDYDNATKAEDKHQPIHDGNEAAEDTVKDQHSASNSMKESKYFVDEDHLKNLEINLTEEEKLARHKTAIEKKNEGNEKFKEQNYETAALLYTEGLKICPLSYEKDRSVLYANRAAARSKVDNEEEKKGSVQDCNKAISLDPSYFKAILRRANLHLKLDNLEEALKDYKQILEMDPRNEEAGRAVMVLPKQIEEKNEKMKEEMLGKLKELGNMVLKPFGLSTNNFKLQQNPETGGYNISFNQNPS